MYPRLKRHRPALSWFSLSLVGLFILSLMLRFWGLSRFNALVFDEIYYANFARGFLTGVQEFGGHPPLSTYLIAGGIWLAKLTPWGNEGLANGYTGIMMTPFSYRWLNALVGAGIPVLVAAIAYQLTYRRTYAVIAGFLIACDGLFLVESRYALNNVYLITFGLLGHLFLLLALNLNHADTYLKAAPRPRSSIAFIVLLLLSGVGFGASAAIKWNGLWFLFGVYLVWAASWITRWINQLRPGLLLNPEIDDTPFGRLSRLPMVYGAIALGLVPALVYTVSWLPFMALKPGLNVIQWQQEVLNYNLRVGGMTTHPYCSPWYTWPFMWRPVAYFYKTAHGLQEPVPVVGPPLPPNAAVTIYDVHAMGNPLLWWLSTAAVICLAGLVIQRAMRWAFPRFGAQRQVRVAGLTRAGYRSATQGLQTLLVGDGDGDRRLYSAVPVITPYTSTIAYLLLNWLGNLIPWIGVERCTFIYHYMESVIFATLAIALLVDRWLHSSQHWHRIVGLTVILAIALAFVFWLPFYLGLPLSPFEVQIRRWLPSWI